MRRGWIPATLILTLGVGAGVARADVTVATATVYGGTGGASHLSVTHDQLARGCSPYSGPNPLSLFGAHGNYAGQAQLSTSDTWDLGTVLSCGLQQDLGAIDSVVVLNPQSGYERALSPRSLSDQGTYRDPGGPGALPVISNDGGEDLNAYVRPWRGGHDDNVSDWIPSGPGAIGLVVYEHGAGALRVSIQADQADQTSSRTRYGFAATVADRGGRPVPANELRWSWSFGDGSPSSTAPYPSHWFAPGRYAVSVEVSDAARGTGGLETIALPVGDGSATGSSPQAGSGTTTPQSGSPYGRRGSTSAGNPGALTGLSGTSGSGPVTTSRIVKTITTTVSGSSGASGKPARAGAGHAGASAHHGTAASRARAHAGPAKIVPVPTGVPAPQTFRIPVGPMVSGELISFTRPPVPAATLTTSAPAPAAPASAPPVRRAVSQSPLFAAGSVALALFVLTLGAAQELRLRPRRVAIVLRPVSQ